MNILNNFDIYLSQASPIAYIAAFISGILVGFTPCVYPLIPVTLGYIGSHSTDSRTRGFLLAVVYVLGMAVAYSFFGALFALSGNLFARFLQSGPAYIFVGGVCLFLSLSLFGFFQHRISGQILPLSSVKPKSLLGTFFVGFVSAFIISPCTTPVLGMILMFVGMKKNIFFGVSLLFTFAFGMGFLLIIIGTFSGILSSLPKSGRWTFIIKKIFAWFLLAVSGFYFLKAGGLF